ncbi:phosphatidyl inositol kinase [Entomortierella lignicola]|nr:phosphatidyl inositol kinase [Entomortierella lignicola]
MPNNKNELSSSSQVTEQDHVDTGNSNNAVNNNALTQQEPNSSHVIVTIPSNVQEELVVNTNNNIDIQQRPEQRQNSSTSFISTSPTRRRVTHSSIYLSTTSTPNNTTDSNQSQTSFQFPRFGINKGLFSSSNNISENSNNQIEVNNNEDGSNNNQVINVGGRKRAVSASNVSDILNLRRKQHGHTTESGPRGIEKAEKRKVLQEIRPDPHNLPEELLREQARSGAAVDALANSALFHQQQNNQKAANDDDDEDDDNETTGLLNTNDSASSSNNSNNKNSNDNDNENDKDKNKKRPVGIGSSGKVNNNRSRWTSQAFGRRHRRVPGYGMGRENDQRVIQSSVFTPVLTSVYDGQPVTPAPALTPDHAEPMTSERFVSIVTSVKEAIRSGIQPLRIAQGSSGSYFCRNLEGKIVGVFKPKNEEPYGQLNPKWAKWIHRNLFPLIPNLGYISEAATSLVDRRLNLNIVPSTEVVWLSSSAFHYDYLDRRAAQLTRGAKPLPDKVGSFQLFLNGFKDANLFMRDHPWPVESVPTLPTVLTSGAGGGDANGKGRYSAVAQHDSEDTDSVTGSSDGSAYSTDGLGPDKPGFNWTPALQQQFREQFEKMIILDYLIRNTDRGLDNWMIRYCEKDGISIVARPPSTDVKVNIQQQQSGSSRRSSRVGDLLGLYSDRTEPRPASPSLRETAGRNAMLATPPGTPPRSNLARTSDERSPQSDDNQQYADAEHTISNAGGSSSAKEPVIADPAVTMESHYGSTHIHVAAIDNGLAFPFKHPDSWRSYPYGWLFLPRPLISQPFTKATRDHFLPLLSSPVWWRETIADLRRLFSIDSDFDQGMFDKQMAVMKGQGWNVVETLKNLEHGPMDLCRRVALVVWDEEVTLEPGVSSMLRRQESRQSLAGEGSGNIGGGGYGTTQTYTSTQPRPMAMMDASKAAYSNYGSIASVDHHHRLSNPKTLSSSSTAIGETIPFLKHVTDQSLRNSFKQSSFKQASFKQPHHQASLPHTVIAIDDDGDNGANENDSSRQPKHDSFRQVVSDGEYDLSDEFDDDDAFSYEEYDDSEGDDDGPVMDGLATLQTQRIVPVAKDPMVSIDMTLLNPEAATTTRNHRRYQSHQSDGGRSRRSKQFSSTGGDEVDTNTARDRSSSATATSLTTGTGDSSNTAAPTTPKAKGYNHRRSRTEMDDRTGTIRFDTSNSGKSREEETTNSSRLLLPSKSAATTTTGGRNSFDDSVKDKHEPVEVERGRSFFRFGENTQQEQEQENDGTTRPKWSDRLRRGLSFDGHLLVGGIGQAARRERYLRKQRQRERELREHRVILVERIEPVTKNLPYFTWW